MRRICRVAALLGLAFVAGCAEPRSAAPVARNLKAEEGSDALHVPVPDDWQTITSGDLGPGTFHSIHIPPGETSETWTQRIVARAYVFDFPVPLDEYLPTLTRELVEGCTMPMMMRQLAQGVDRGYPVRVYVAGCGRTRVWDSGVLVFMKIIEGETGVFHVQRSWRLPPKDSSGDLALSGAEQQQAIEFLRDVFLCRVNGEDIQC